MTNPPADAYDATTDIVNGVVTIQVDDIVASPESDGIMQNAVTAKLTEVFGTSPNNLADHVMYCMPPGVIGFIAYAYVNSWNSVYNNDWCVFDIILFTCFSSHVF